MKDFKNTLLGLFVFSIAFSGCLVHKQADIEIDIESIYNQILKDSVLVSGWYYITETDNGFKKQLDKTNEFYFIDPKPILIKDHFEKMEIFETNFKGQYPDYIGLKILINKKYFNLWAEATEKAIGKRLALIIDNKLVNAPMVNGRIESGVSSLNRTVYSRKELEDFKAKLE